MIQRKKIPVSTIILLVVCIGLAAVLPAFIKSSYYRRMIFEMFIYAALGSAWNIIGGFARQTSWASGSFFSAGAYAAMIMFVHWQITPWAGMFVGVLIAIFLALVIGLPTLRLRGVYFAIATISCEGIVTQIWKNLKLAGKSNGITLPNVTGVNSVSKMIFTSELPYYYIALVWLIVVVAICVYITKSKLGYYLNAIRDDEDAAIAMGMKTQRIKLAALVISSVLMAVTGVFFAFRNRTVNPNLVATHDVSVKIAITAIIGGMGTIAGPVLGGVIVVGLFELANNVLGTIGGGAAGYLVYGLMMMVVVVAKPEGLISILEKLYRKVVSLASKKEVSAS